MFFLLDEDNGYTARFLGFSVYISNTTNKENGVLCFKDTNYTRATIPNPTDIPCPQHGRYVIYYNNRTHFPYPVGYSDYAYNELCELEVLGEFLHKYILEISFKSNFLKDWLIDWLIDILNDRSSMRLTNWSKFIARNVSHFPHKYKKINTNEFDLSVLHVMLKLLVLWLTYVQYLKRCYFCGF